MKYIDKTDNYKELKEKYNERFVFFENINLSGSRKQPLKIEETLWDWEDDNPLIDANKIWSFILKEVIPTAERKGREDREKEIKELKEKIEDLESYIQEEGEYDY